MHVIQKTTEEYYAHFSPSYAARRALQVLQGGVSQHWEEDATSRLNLPNRRSVCRLYPVTRSTSHNAA